MGTSSAPNDVLPLLRELRSLLSASPPPPLSSSAPRSRALLAHPACLCLLLLSGYGVRSPSLGRVRSSSRPPSPEWFSEQHESLTEAGPTILDYLSDMEEQRLGVLDALDEEL
ncbi:hypothetical protein TeGR_g3278 [Tetraparma gracilis]|uniref:Uncharacterized protein n=1 Tax=Tetraparma gracilis TaxID=2962635 RepID=A0ABQ6N777_9STRA|nr:hypothetical protein TeGR_g3278 [Tetraparma gracilis]